jgi:hypothetical protein
MKPSDPLIKVEHSTPRAPKTATGDLKSPVFYAFLRMKE